MYPQIAQLAKELGRSISIFDTETTGGTGPVIIVEIAFLSVDEHGGVSKYEALINPDKPISYYASQVHGITDEMVRGRDTYSSISQNINKIFSDSVVSGYNSQYDLRAVRDSSAAANVDTIEPAIHLDIRKVWMSHSKSNKGKLGEVAEYYGVVTGNAHRAMGDVIMTAGLLEKMLEKHGFEYVLEACCVTGHEKKVQKKSGARSETGKNEDSPKISISTKILTHLLANDKILCSDYASFAELHSSTVSAVSFAVSDLFKAGKITVDQVVDEEQQTSISGYLSDIIEMHGNNAQNLKYKPLKNALDQALGTEVDYTQIRVAVERLSLKNKIDASILLCETASLVECEGSNVFKI